MFQLNPRTEPAGPQGTLAKQQASKQNARLLIALSLLLVTLAVILIEDRNFWFGSDQAFATNVSASEKVVQPKPLPPRLRSRPRLRMSPQQPLP
jgi:hypothetical protein